MSRCLGRRPLTIAAATLAVLVAPAAANAASYTVSPGAGSCGGADLACGGLAEAAAAAASGDVFAMSPGIYSGANFTTGGITITGAAGVLINATVQFSGAAGGVSKMSNVAVAQTASTGPGVLVTGASGLELTDAVVLSSNDHGIFMSASAANKVLRTIVGTGGAQSSAIRVESSPGISTSLLAESVLTSGGAQGIGAFSKAAALNSAGNISLTLHHISAAGSTNGVVIDSSAGVAGILVTGGNIAATMTDSIAFPNVVKNQPGLLGVLLANTATLTAPPTRNLTDPASDKKAIFADPTGGNYRLRPGSPAIGQGSVEAGESATDIDGEDRSASPTDFGGDEFNNAPPVAKVVVTTKTPRATQPVTFDAGGSTDREAKYGGGIVGYAWTFSDGKTETTSGPTVNHAFEKEGAASASVIVVDRQGAQSTAASVSATLIDGTAPAVGIAKPKANQKIRLITRKTTTKTVDGVKRKTTKRTRTKIVFGGLSFDASGVAQIALTLEKLGTTTTSKCNWFNPKRGVVRSSCRKPVFILAKLVKDSKTGEWGYTVKRKLTKGRYRLSAVGIDKTGMSGNSGGPKLGIIRFRLI